MNFQPVLTKILYNFLDQRYAKTLRDNYTGQPFAPIAWIQQGSSSSPTLFAIYAVDIPHPAFDCSNIQYADGITQIIAYNGKSRHIIAILRVQEITKLND